MTNKKEQPLRTSANFLQYRLANHVIFYPNLKLYQK